MKESIIEKYFYDKVSANKLDNDINGSEIRTGNDTTCVNVEIIDSTEEFVITSKHLVKLAEDVTNNKISVTNLASLAFALEGSDYFVWDNGTIDGEKVARVLFEWDNEKINYPINLENLKLWVYYLKTGKHELKQ